MTTTSADAAELRRIDGERMSNAVRSEVRHQLNVAYGDHPRQVLDVYYPLPRTVSLPAPVLVFLHGGGFRTGTPARNAYQGRAALEHGALFVSMGYRLIPEARFPDSVEDVEQGLLWLREHVAEHGGDPERIYVSGHSAGAMLAAWVVLRQSAVDFVRGAVLISGFYDLSQQPSDIVNPESPRFVPRLAEAIERVPPHTVIVFGERDLPGAEPAAHALHAALQARGASVELFVEPDADHYAANRGFISTSGAVFQSVKRMMDLHDPR
ncbi:MAG TPA: alpha/beta hydrolase [Chloroflexota bacterium]